MDHLLAFFACPSFRAFGLNAVGESSSFFITSILVELSPSTVLDRDTRFLSLESGSLLSQLNRSYALLNVEEFFTESQIH
uniref:Uncharacterized protein n=1 Tax=Utricularia reniformis TaxID=192314 RepID=A0A1Y0B073_9LAMI|nr:hypothetical protein AEK19_MT0569 [Utricularia reniformis]ART30825.1 hypothetical protein AEK19_MT0569 [Utricularia reniformis]